MIRKEIEHLAINIDELHTHPSNVRQGDIGAISESLEAHGQYRSIVYQQSTKRILAGNHTYKAAKALGWTHIAATPVICDDEQALRILLADNKANDLATYDEPELIELLKQLADTSDGLLGTLFDGDELDSLIEDNSHFELPTDVDDVPENVPAVSNLGDLWVLGNHKVMCGDSTKHSDVSRLLLGQSEVQMIFTDPPYGMSYGGGRARGSTVKGALVKAHGMIMNDDLQDEQLVDLITESIKVGTSFLTQDGSLYVCLTWRTYTEFESAIQNAGRKIDNCIIWDKQSIGLGNSHYRPQHEFIFYSKGQWNGDKAQTDVWHCSRGSTGEYVHPTQKPVELIAKAIKNSTTQNQIVLDLFGGSGSTLIAAQETNRTAYLMELDPRYVDVICARYQKHTGNQPVLEATGEPHNFTPDADQ